jgi:hypothetical protein
MNSKNKITKNRTINRKERRKRKSTHKQLQQFDMDHKQLTWQLTVKRISKFDWMIELRNQINSTWTREVTREGILMELADFSPNPHWNISFPWMIKNEWTNIWKRLFEWISHQNVKWTTNNSQNKWKWKITSKSINLSSQCEESKMFHPTWNLNDRWFCWNLTKFWGSFSPHVNERVCDCITTTNLEIKIIKTKNLKIWK